MVENEKGCEIDRQKLAFRAHARNWRRAGEHLFQK
jgi:hypothetical protein